MTERWLGIWIDERWEAAGWRRISKAGTRCGRPWCRSWYPAGRAPRDAAAERWVCLHEPVRRLCERICVMCIPPWGRCRLISCEWIGIWWIEGGKKAKHGLNDIKFRFCIGLSSAQVAYLRTENIQLLWLRPMYRRLVIINYELLVVCAHFRLVWVWVGI